jgi:hypothetical protein
MKTLIVVLAVFACNLVAAKDKATINYVGQGRYTCSGDRHRCAQIDAQNRLNAQIDADRYERTRQREIDRYERFRENYLRRENNPEQ